jgi:hypothetical protein
MPNPLTGDFEAVLQVSGGTINRLLASMHQNAFQNPKLPSFPHTVRMRIGDDHAFEGVRGVVHAQVAVPRVELIHGATDRFILEVGVRAWYRPDPGTEPLPAFINGTLRAEYRVQDIDPSCPGWSRKAADFLWIRVVRDSVRFQGTAEDEASIQDLVVAGAPSDPAANIAKITRQAARLLARRFEASPQNVSDRFRRGSLRSLNAPIGGSAIAVPLGLSGEPWGDIASIDNVLLSGSDLALAVDIGYIMTQVNSALEPLRTFNRSFPVEDFTVYHVGVHPSSVQWLAHGSYGVFKIRVSGWANTNSVVLPNATCDIEQDVTVYFDGGLKLSPGSLTVHVHASGMFSGMVVSKIREALLTAVPPIALAACNAVQGPLNKKISEGIGELSCQMRSWDDQASVWLDSAEFGTYGLVMRGTIGLAARRGVVVKHEKTAGGDAHSALESWIPGGRIDRMEWSWTWSGSGDPGKATFQDRFLLRRPRGKVSRWGMAVGLTTPLPGLDGWGKVCLRMTGVRVDPVTGQFVTVTSTTKCARFGFSMAELTVEGGRLFLRDMPELSQDVPFPLLKDLPLMAARGSRSGPGAANTLLVYVDEAWTGETAELLRGGLEGCRRYDAGLGVLVLFREGVLDAEGPRVIPEIEKFTRRLGIPAHVNEDVNGAWSRALELRAGPGETAWAIITPEGNAAWKVLGRIEPQTLAAALDTHLCQCPDLKPAAYRPAVEIGAAIWATALHPGIGDLADLAEPRCPPIPLDRFSPKTVITFVQKRSGATETQLRKLAAEYGLQEGESRAGVVVVVDGADPREAEALKNELGVDFAVVADPSGTLNDRFGVDVWPTTITLDRSGALSEVEPGIFEPRAREALGGEPDRSGHAAG